MTGATTTCRAVSTIPHPSTGSHAPANHCVRTGVTTTAATVEQNVITTDNATFALAMNATTFDAVPPGQHATSIRPTARSGGNPNARATTQPALGITRNWAKKPVATARGIFPIALKAPTSSVIPMPSMMKANAQVIHGPLNQVNASGRTIAIPQNPTNHAGNQFAAARIIFNTMTPS